LHCYLRNDKVIVDANLLLFSDVLINWLPQYLHD
jgi:hypothetical protein